MDRKDVGPVRFARLRDIDEAVQASASKQRRVDDVGSVGGRKDRHIVELLDPVHFGQDLVQHVLRRPASIPGAPGRGQRVQLIEEDDRGGDLAGFLEDVADGFFRLAHPFGQQLGPLDRDEVRPAFMGHGLCDERFPGSRRAVEQNAFGRFDPELLERILFRERILDRLPHVPDRFPASADVRPGDVCCVERDLTHGRRRDLA